MLLDSKANRLASKVTLAFDRITQTNKQRAQFESKQPKILSTAIEKSEQRVMDILTKKFKHDDYLTFVQD